MTESSVTGKYVEKDRISSLPDDVLSHILSLMPTKYAFQTSLLSTRWKSLWTLAPTIDLGWYGISAVTNSTSFFMDFVDRVLLLQNLPNKKIFRLCIRSGYCNAHRLDSWISTAIKLNVQELDLIFEMGFVYELPRSLLTSANLVILKLSGQVAFQFPMFVFLQSLKVLHLYSLQLLDKDFLENLLAGCPILEELDITRFETGSIQTLFICSSSLKKLNLSYSFPSGVAVKAPALEILAINDYVTKPIDLDELPSLVKAEFCVFVPKGNYGVDPDYMVDDPYNMVDGMLAKIPNVETLRFSSHTLEVVIQTSAYEQLMFYNLTNLQIDLHNVIQPAPFPELLGHIPNLKVFVLSKVIWECRSCLWREMSQNRPKCLTLFLEKFVFRGFDGCEAELKLLRYLLENAMVLKKLSLTSRFMNKRIRRQILKLPRGSSKCEIELL